MLFVIPIWQVKTVFDGGIRECEHPRPEKLCQFRKGSHARNLTGLRGTLIYACDLACTTNLRPCFQASLQGVHDGNLCARFLSHSKHSEVPWQDEKSQNFPQQVVSGNSYNRTGTNYGIFLAVGQSLIEDWNWKEVIVPARWSQWFLWCFLQRIAKTLPAGQSPIKDWNSNEVIMPAKWSQYFLQRITETLSAVLVVSYIDVSFAYYLTFSKIHS